MPTAGGIVCASGSNAETWREPHALTGLRFPGGGAATLDCLLPGRGTEDVNLPPAPFGRETIESIIPHRPPFLLVDEVLELEPGRRVRGRFLVPEDGWWFRGHFPDRPVMPGVLTIEAIAQCGAVAVLTDEANRGKIPFFAGIDDCRFKRVVAPGEELELECEFLRVRGPIAKGQGRASVGGDVAAEAMLTVFVGDGGAA